VARVFKGWGFTSTNIRHRNVLKFTVENIANYVGYTSEITSFNPLRIAYLDEASYESRSLMRKRGKGPSGQRINAIVDRKGSIRTTCHSPSLTFAVV
jgi:hypothetical protein